MSLNAQSTGILQTNPPADGEDPYHFDAQAALANLLLHNLQLARETLSTIVDGLQTAEKNKVTFIKKQVEDLIEQIHKAKKAAKLNKIFKALSIVGLVLAALAAVIVPTPATIAIFTVTLAMVLEPVISEAAGKNSLIEMGMSKLMQALQKHFGEVGGLIMGCLVMMAITLISVSSLSSGLSMLGSNLAKSAAAAGEAATAAVSETGNTTAKVSTMAAETGTALTKTGTTAGETGAKTAAETGNNAANTSTVAAEAASESSGVMSRLLEKCPQLIKDALAGELTEAQMNGVLRFLEAIDACLVMAQGSLKVLIGLLQYQIAQLECGIQEDSAQVELLKSIIKAVGGDASNYQTILGNLNQYLAEVHQPVFEF